MLHDGKNLSGQASAQRPDSSWLRHPEAAILALQVDPAQPHQGAAEDIKSKTET